MTIVGFKAHQAADEGRAWDGDAARSRLLAWAGGPAPAGEGSNKEQVDWDRYRQGFAWFDGQDAESLGAYKLPHSDVLDGEICDVWSGVNAAMGALLGGRGGVDIPSGDRQGVYNHLARHYRQWDKEVPDLREYSAAELRALFPQLYGGVSWGLTTVRAQLSAGLGQDVAAQALTTINSKFAQHELIGSEIYLLPPAEMSNTNLDSYFTRMAPSSLHNYRQDGREGVPLMNSHRWLLPAPELPLGQSYDATLEEEGDPSQAGASGRLRLVELFYMLRGLELNGHKTDHLIRAIEGGTIRDVSIGYRGGWYRCGLCGRELAPLMMLSGEGGDCCEHVPGVRYDGQLAYAWVEDAHQAEGSLVYAGATPEAVLRKAQWAASTGRLARGEVSALEDQWGVRIADSSQQTAGSWKQALGSCPEEGTGGCVAEQVGTGDEQVQEANSGPTPSAGADHSQQAAAAASTKPLAADCLLLAANGEEGKGMTKEEVLRLAAERAPELEARLAEAEEPVGALLDAWQEAQELAQKQRQLAEATTQGLQERLVEAEARISELNSLRPLAEDGRAYREALIAEAVEARVRAQGNDFDAEAYRQVLAGQPLAYVQGEIRAWDAAAHRVFEAGRVVGKVLARQGLPAAAPVPPRDASSYRA